MPWFSCLHDIIKLDLKNITPHYIQFLGKNPFEGKMNGGQSMTELSKMEERKKEQKRAL